MNGGKDVKIGHDKRPVSVVPSDEQLLYNIANGEVLTDEFGNPLITEVDQFFLEYLKLHLLAIDSILFQLLSH